jgi:hypothetical protein
MLFDNSDPLEQIPARFAIAVMWNSRIGLGTAKAQLVH